MKCTKCGMKEANVFITKNINGKVTKQCLCDECAESEDLNIFEHSMSNMFSSHSRFFNDDFFNMDNFFNILTPRFRVLPERREKLSNEEKANLDELLGENNNPIKTFKRFKVKKKEVKMTKDEVIKKLENDLQKAIEEERYEDAAILRDKIKALNK